jgi:hypothetical protein
MSQWGQDSDDSVPVFVEVPPPQGLFLNDGEEVKLGERSDRLHDVEDKARTPLGVCMEDPKPGVETNHLESQLTLYLEESIEIVEHGVQRIAGVPSHARCYR